MPNTVETTPKLTEAQAIELANEIIRLESTVKAMKEQLKAYVEENGELVTDEFIWGFQDAASWKFHPDKVKDFMKNVFVDYGVNPYEMVNFSKPKLDKLGLDEAYLSKFADKKITRRFGKKKLK